MTNFEIQSLFNGLATVRQDATMRLPARTSFTITRNIKLLQPIVEDMAESRIKVLETYGTRDEANPGMFNIPPENRQKVTEELEALDKVDNDVSLIKIKLSDLDHVELSVQVMEQLYPLIEEEG